MNSSPQKIFIHYDAERVDYSLSKDELENIKSIGQNNWKDFSIACFAVGIPCLLNAISEVSQQKVFSITLSFNLNLVIGLLGIVLGVAFLFAWQRTKSNFDEIIKRVKDKPKVELMPLVTNIGEIQEKDGEKQKGA